MELSNLYLAGYLLFMNLLGLIAMRHDKKQAKRRGRRVPENTLMLIAFAGGALGAWLGMYAYRHKTKHAAFIVGVPLLLLWNVLAVLFLVDRLPAV